MDASGKIESKSKADKAKYENVQNEASVSSLVRTKWTPATSKWKREPCLE